MPPNRRESREEFEFNKGKKEIYYNGYFYDVTEFISRHPGGNIIKFYTELGEDATEPIQQFHFRSMKKVDAIMKSLPKRAAQLHERGLEGKVLSRHEALSADFKKLFEELVAEGYFEPSIPHVILRLLENVALTILSYGIFFQCEHFLSKGLAALFCGFAYSRYGWVFHEGGHMSLTGNKTVDNWIQDFAGCVVLGGSSAWWNSQHNRHHAMPQRLHHDVDLATLPFVAFHRRTVKDRSQIFDLFVRWQGFLYWTLDLVVITIAWRAVLHPKYQLHKKKYFEMLLCMPSLLLAVYVGVGWYYFMMYWFAFFLGLNFALSHSHLEVADKPTHWIEYGLTHTADVSHSMAVDYIMGYLNYQIEHHLFPSMPQFRQRDISPRVKALAEKHGLPYTTYGYWEACYLAMKNLDTVGRELTSKDQFKNENYSD